MKVLLQQLQHAKHRLHVVRDIVIRVPDGVQNPLNVRLGERLHRSNRLRLFVLLRLVLLLQFFLRDALALHLPCEVRRSLRAVIHHLPRGISQLRILQQRQRSLASLQEEAPHGLQLLHRVYPNVLHEARLRGVLQEVHQLPVGAAQLLRVHHFVAPSHFEGAAEEVFILRERVDHQPLSRSARARRHREAGDHTVHLAEALHHAAVLAIAAHRVHAVRILAHLQRRLHDLQKPSLLRR
mmetsp:Transcript_9695/g.36381  ORF Transcript_9695/g.36381 Transcript_9695/m.36381 type:complete len:239 (-) Transcript_9695:483-1199(-)